MRCVVLQRRGTTSTMLDFLRPAMPALLAVAAFAALPAVAQTPTPVTTPGPAMSPGPVMTAAPMATVMPIATPLMSPSPAASPIPTPSNPPENTLVTARVRAAFEAWQRGGIDRKAYTPDAGGTYIDAFVEVVKPDLAAIGPVQSVTYQSAALLLNDLVYRYDVTGPSGDISVLYSLDQAGKVDGIVFTPLIFRSAAPIAK